MSNDEYYLFPLEKREESNKLKQEAKQLIDSISKQKSFTILCSTRIARSTQWHPGDYENVPDSVAVLTEKKATFVSIDLNDFDRCGVAYLYVKIDGYFNSHRFYLEYRPMRFQATYTTHPLAPAPITRTTMTIQ